MEAGEFGELGRGQISDVGLPIREFKLHPESKTAVEGWGGRAVILCNRPQFPTDPLILELNDLIFFFR